MIGKRPINSGIKPNFNKSSGKTLERSSLGSISCSLISEPNPITFCPRRRLIIVSIPSNAPPQINKIFVVSI